MQELSRTLASRIYDSISSELSEPITVSRSMANDTLPLAFMTAAESAHRLCKYAENTPCFAEIIFVKGIFYIPHDFYI